MVIAFSNLIYILIIIKVRSSNKIHVNSKTAKISKKLFIMPFLIVLTFFLFAFLPNVIAYNVHFDKKHTKKVLIISLIGINVLNNVSDPIIYIYLQPAARKRLVGFIKRLHILCCQQKQEALLRSGIDNNSIQFNSIYLFDFGYTA